jgi:hypothetical protein
MGVPVFAGRFHLASLEVPLLHLRSVCLPNAVFRGLTCRPLLCKLLYLHLCADSTRTRFRQFVFEKCDNSAKHLARLDRARLFRELAHGWITCPLDGRNQQSPTESTVDQTHTTNYPLRSRCIPSRPLRTPLGKRILPHPFESAIEGAQWPHPER